jgi:LemA protein
MAGGQSPAHAAETEGMLSQALGRLIAVAEAYPDLKANQNFLSLQAELSSTEDRIASSRRYYNALVRDLNTKVESVPTNFVANMAGIRRAEYFETAAVEAQAPSVDFGAGGTGSVGSAGAPPVGGSTQPGAVGGPSTQPGGVQGADVPTRAPGSDPLVTSGHGDEPSPLPQAEAPDPTVDRTPPRE